MERLEVDMRELERTVYRHDTEIALLRQALQTNRVWMVAMVIGQALTVIMLVLQTWFRGG